MSVVVLQPLDATPRTFPPISGITSASIMSDKGLTAHLATPNSQTYHDSTERTETDHTVTSNTPSQSTAKKRKTPKSKVPLEVRRSSSTPHMRGTANSDVGTLSPTAADKRRNKLGYHRTSVACGHCRRRKIRCLVAQDDPQGRCSNCIRLKKECNFYSVEQEAQNHQSQTTRSDVDSNKATPASNPSSPQLNPVSSLDPVDDYASYQPDARAPNPQYPYVDMPLANNQWESSPYIGHNIHGLATQPHPSNVPQMAFNQQDAANWNPAPRSMSLGNPESLQHPFSSQHHLGATPPGYGDRPAHFFPPPLNTSIAGSIPISMSAMTAPVSGGSMSHFNQPQWSYSNEQMAAHNMNMPNQGYTGQQWYTEPMPMHNLEEEVVPASNNQRGPPHFYPTTQGMH